MVLHRRDFMAVAGAIGFQAAMLMDPLGLSAVEREPVKRGGGARIRFSLAAYSYRELLTAKPPKLTLADFVRDCANLQLDATELTSYYFPADVTPDYLREIKQLCFLLGLDISGTAIGNDFGFPAGEERQKQIAAAKKWIDYAEILGAPVIRIFAGHDKPGVDRETSHRLMVEGMEECCDYAGQHGVHLALENHGGPTATADGLLKLYHDVKSPWFGINVDTGNFNSADVYSELERIAPFAINVQLKVVVNQAGKGKEPTDMKRIAQILKNSGYRGYVALEYEEKEDPVAACKKYVAEMREAFA